MSGKNEQGGIDVKQKNVLQKPLHQHAKSGYCNESSPIAAAITSSFLSFASSNGLNLSNASAGDRACISASDWKTALDKGSEAEVPKVKLESSHVAALDSVDLATLKRFAAGQDVDRGVEWTSDMGRGEGRGFVREAQSIGGSEPKA